MSELTDWGEVVDDDGVIEFDVDGGSLELVTDSYLILSVVGSRHTEGGNNKCQGQ